MTTTPDDPTASGSVEPLVLGHLRLEERLGDGAAGVVYRGRLLADRHYGATGTVVAVKVLRPSFLGEGGAFQRFLREAQIGRQIDHPGVVRALEADAVNTPTGLHHFLVFEYVQGQTLSAKLKREGAMAEALVRHLGAQIASALAAVHDAGAVHRDVKPANVLVTPDHQVKLLDFGILHEIAPTARLTASSQFLGTIAYAAPEQFHRPQEIGTGADLFALGATLFELATGQAPFPDTDLVAAIRARERPARRARTVEPRLTGFLDEALAALLEIDPANRPRSALEVAVLLEQGEDSAWWRGRRPVHGPRHGLAARIHVGRETPFVEREEETRRLLDRLEQCRAGRGGIVLLEGETGAGKTRLVDALIGRLGEAADPPRILYGTYPPGDAASAYAGFAAGVVDHLGETDLEVALGGFLGPARHLAATLGALLAGVGGGGPGREVVQTLFGHLARGLVQRGPVLWCVEDLHFAPAEGRALLLALARAAASLPLLLVTTTRPGLPAADLDALLRLPGAQRLEVGRLTPRGVIRFLAAALGSEVLAERLGGKVALRSDGNPYFILEILQELRERGAIRREPDGSFRAAGSTTDVGIPSSVRALVRERLGALPDEDRAILDLGAAIGYVFDPDLIARARCLKPLRVLEALAAMERRAAVVRSAGSRFEFQHPHIRDFILDATPPALRAEYNSLVAEAFADRHGLGGGAREPSGEETVFLASHYLHGSRPEAGLACAAAAIDHLAARHQHEAVIELAEAALAVLGERDPGRSADLRLRQAPSLESLGNHREQAAVLARAVEEASAAGDPRLAAAARRHLGRFFYGRGDVGAARPHLEQAAALARAAADAEVEALAESDLGLLCNQEGHPDRARAHLERASELARRHGLAAVELSALGNLGLVELEAGRYAAAAAMLERQRDLAAERGNRLAASRAEGNLGLAELYLGRHDRASACYERQVAICREIGYRPGEAIATGNLAGLHYHLGDLGPCHERFGLYLALSRDVGSRLGEATALVNLGVVALEEGALEEASERLGAGLALAHELGAARLEADALHAIGEERRAAGDLGGALASHHQALGLRRQAEAPESIAISLVALGRLLLERGETAAAVAALEEARELASTTPGQEPGPLPAAYLALAGGGGAGSIEVPPGMPAPVRAETHLVIARAGAGEEHAEQAKAILDRMSAHLAGEAIDRFWRFNPVARAWIDRSGVAGG